MRLEELAPERLASADLGPASGEPRLQHGARWLGFVDGALDAICGPGATLRVLVARDDDGPLAAIPMLRTSPSARPRPFPLDLEDMFFGLWIRNAGPELRTRARASYAFGAILRALNPSLGRALVLHAPLSPVSDALVAPRLSPAQATAALAALFGRAREIAADEGRCAFVPRLARHPRVRPALDGWLRLPSYANAELLPRAPLARDPRQMLKRNRRLVERAGVTFEVTRAAPPDVPFGARFAATAARHRDPAPRLDDGFFRDLAARFPDEARFLVARAGGLPVAFVAVLRQGPSWEAFKCGSDRALAGGAPVHLDLLYGRLRELAAGEGVARVDLGPGDLDVKQRYGARAYPIDTFVALPPGFRGGRAFTAYLRAVSDGIERRERQVSRVATTPK